MASGSPDSYHVYIPILPTPIEIVHEFLKTVLAELKKTYPNLNWSGTEVFPKQSNKDRTLGNALKLPLAINNKTGKRADLLGADLEPVDVIFITTVAELRDPIEEAVKVGERLYIPTKILSRPAVSYKRISSMRPCITAALTKQLNGGEGNDMRIAVVCEAHASGKSRDEIVEMFKGQADYDEATTAKNVDYIMSRGYHPWRCSTIHDRCSSFVDCERCPIAPRIESAREESATVS